MKFYKLIIAAVAVFTPLASAQVSPLAIQIEAAISKKEIESAHALASKLSANAERSSLPEKAEAAYYLGATKFLLGNQDAEAEQSLKVALQNFNQMQDATGIWKSYYLMTKLYFDHRDKFPNAWTQIAKELSSVEPATRRQALGVSKNADGNEIYRSLCQDQDLGAMEREIQEILSLLRKDSKHGQKVIQDQVAWEEDRNRDLELLGFGRNGQLSRWDYYNEGVVKLAEARKESLDRAKGSASGRLKSLNQIAQQLNLTERGKTKDFAFEGFNDSGERWAYEFIEHATQPTLSLASDSTGLILYADSKWVVRAVELEGTVSAGSTNLKTELSFYNSRTGKLVAIFSMPNRVFQVGTISSSGGNLFFVGTLTPSKYRFDDVPMAVTLLDLDKRVLERVPVVADDYWLALNNSLEINPSSQGITIRVHPGLAQQYVKAQPKSQHFKPIKISFLENIPRTGDPDYFDQSIKKHISAITNDQAGLSYLGQTPTFARHADWGKGHFSFLTTPVSPMAPKIIATDGSGRLNLFDLNKLMTDPVNLGVNGAYLPHFFKDGSFSCISGSNLVFFEGNRQKTVPIPDSDLSALQKILKAGDILQLGGASNDPKNAPRKLFFSESNVGYRVGDSFYQLNPSSEGEFKRLILSESVKSLLQKNENNRIMDWDLGTGTFVISRHDADLYEYQTIAIDSGKSKGATWQGGAQFAFNDLTHSNSSQGWRAVSYINDSHTGGATSCVSLHKEGDGQEPVLVANELRNNASPLAINFSDGKNLIVYGSGDTVTLARLDLSKKKVESVKIWKFASRFGKSLIESNSGQLFIPNASGFEVWSVWESQPQKRFNLVLGADSSYCVVLPDNKFAGSPGCENLLSFKSSNATLEGSSVSPWRNRPADVLKAIGGDPSQVEVLSKVTERWLKKLGNPERNPEPTASDIPSLALANDVPLWAEGEAVKLQFIAKPGTAPVKDVVVRVNGVDQQRGSNSIANKSSVERTVKLAEGQNWIEAVAIDEKGHSSNLVRFRTILSKAAKPTKRYIIAIGVSKYRDSALNLEFAAKDATDLASAVKESTKGETEVLLLTNDQATKDAPAKIREFLANATENEEVVAFCAGHGVLDSNLDYVYASHEFDSANPSETGIKLDELVDAIGSSKSLKRILLLDTCHSGQVGEKDEMLLAQMNTELPKGVRAVKQRGMSVKPVAGLSAEGQQRFIEEMFLLPGIHRGINIIGASGGAEFALESAQWNNGVFTASIIEALRDKKADLNGDARISVGELRDFLGQRVSELTKGAQKPSVVAAERDQDFDLIRAAYKKPSPEQTTNDTPPEDRQTSDNSSVGLQEFFDSWMLSHQSNSPDQMASHYADQVNYCYEKGITSREKIRSGIASLMKGFPNRNYSELKVEGSDPDGHGGFKITYSYRYAYSGKKNVSGRAKVTITVLNSDGSWKITRFDEKTTKL